MTKTQVQLPDALYRDAKRVAKEREISLAEVMRRGLEYITRIYPPLKKKEKGRKAWTLPVPLKQGIKSDPFEDEDWRATLAVDTTAQKSKSKR